ncbi:hypothetical protein DPMN_151211 [Dreissena polymorpha]|uniref:Uncharacterized protein n=1 Tax=Dreissena polymorpha TaxID=45954 RepID=A0A9D4FKR4_DREPO|nr:hypothetical protein DPMN_151211 [Dreissena polymorpha]
MYTCVWVIFAGFLCVGGLNAVIGITFETSGVKVSGINAHGVKLSGVKIGGIKVKWVKVTGVKASGGQDQWVKVSVVKISGSKPVGSRSVLQKLKNSVCLITRLDEGMFRRFYVLVAFMQIYVWIAFGAKVTVTNNMFSN